MLFALMTGRFVACRIGMSQNVALLAKPWQRFI
jgi:hypothetical protein